MTMMFGRFCAARADLDKPNAPRMEHRTTSFDFTRIYLSGHQPPRQVLCEMGYRGLHSANWSPRSVRPSPVFCRKSLLPRPAEAEPTVPGRAVHTRFPGGIHRPVREVQENLQSSVGVGSHARTDVLGKCSTQADP